MASWVRTQLKDQASSLKGVNRYEAGDPSSADSRQIACRGYKVHFYKKSSKLINNSKTKAFRELFSL
jgi:hypothetical protein